MFRGFRPWSKLAGFALLGGFFGGASYVAYISNAASYLSDDPKACINCHIMTPMYASWQHSSHANDGLRHSYLFTTRQERQVIEAIPASKAVIQQNCIRCHEPTLQRASTSVAHFEKRPCIECHREVPHGREHSLSSTPNAAVPPLEPVTPEWMRKRP
jgi:cytochrome c nitrite reductase small subunit